MQVLQRNVGTTQIDKTHWADLDPAMNKTVKTDKINGSIVDIAV